MKPAFLVLLPSFNSGTMLERVVRSALENWPDVWVVIDASTDGSPESLDGLLAKNPRLRRIILPRNSGKGGAVLAGMKEAREEGFTHALVMDADGQHPAGEIAAFLRCAAEHPDCMVLGEPVFGPDAPPERVKGRRIGNWWTNLATLWGGIHDSLFGFRVYPIRESVEILDSIRTARRFDFDTELAVRLYWRGVRPVNRRVPVTYPAAGGISHFRYVRDNLLLTGTHARLFLGMLVRVPRLIRYRRR